MSWPLPKNVLAVDDSKPLLRVAKAKYSFGKMIVQYEKDVFSENIEERKRSLRDLEILPEDVIVTTIGSGMVLYLDMDVPPNLKRKDLINIGRAEAARVMGIPVDNISVFPIGRIGAKALFVVAKISDIESSVVERLAEMGLPEPDVVIPDAMKYLYDTSIPTHGNVLYIIANFFKDYVSNVLVVESQVVGVRSISAKLPEVFNVVSEKFGVTMKELFKINDLRLLKEVEDFLRDGFIDLAMEINREVLSLLKSSIVEVSQEKLDLVVLVSDPYSFSFPLSFALSEAVGFKVTVEKIKGIDGLLKRGGMEFGKVKSVLKKG